MKVKELVEHLQKLDQEAMIAYELHSEYCLMEPNQIYYKNLCHPREDGWIHEERPDKKTIKYLVFPGN